VVRVEPPGSAVAPDADTAELARLGAPGHVVWVRGPAVEELAAARERALAAGIDTDLVVLEPPLHLLGDPSLRGASLGWDADHHGARPGGALEALVVLAVTAGVVVIRTGHPEVARRAADVALALMAEREPAGAPAP
jgi:hypothetical protein